ncbi:type II secretion system F family protein [Candidatus Stoquefichus massiliensis]|uniref:type II secretion system F family protein n=1 Tax=Candidatus Stoquefichus massiliensis TaxID=1470350 RepID=UPI0004830DED|nr:type II secretion system F family protein [Candidatus Stoquefichus massiliensis]
MNKDYMFLKNLYTLLESGYSVEESLKICQNIMHYPMIEKMIDKLRNGESLEVVISYSDFPKLFLEYFYFFKNKNCLSEAIQKSLDICVMKQEYQNQLKSKLTYPLILMAFLLLFSIFVVFVLLPNVNQLFDSFQIHKSFMTQLMFLFFYTMPIFVIGIGVSVIFLLVRLFYALQKKSYQVIEWYLKLPIFKVCLQKYFSLKFAVYYHELLNEEIDSTSIIALLNEQMTESDLKIVLYEINNRLHDGEALEDILEDFEYFDQLFLSFFQMYMKNPNQKQSLSHYIDLTYEQIDLWISQFLKYFVPSIYGFVAIFVITIYVSIIIPMMNVISDI